MEKRNLRKENQKGFSLVELLVAMSILAIIVGPFLHSFVTATRTNSKARLTSYATTVSQDVMEGFKAYDMERILRQFHYSEAAGGDASMWADNPFSMISLNHGSVQEVADATGAALPDGTSHISAVANADGTYSYKVNEEDTYYFAINNIQMESRNYDAIIRMDAGTYQSTYNDASLANIGNISNATSAVYVESDQSTQDDVYTYFDETGTITEEDFIDIYLNKTITLKIERQAGNKAKVTQQYEYICNQPSILADTVENQYLTVEQTMFDNYASEDELHNVYLFYRPYYSNSGLARDTIIIENTDNVPVTVYLVELKDDSTYLESLYRAAVTLNETPTTGTEAATTICTNLLAVSSSGTVRKYNWNYMGTNGVSDTEIVKELNNPEQANRIYSMTVDIYTTPEGDEARYQDQDKVATFNGSTAE